MSPRLVLDHYQRSLEIRPTAKTWMNVGYFHLNPRLGTRSRLAIDLPQDLALQRDPDAALAAFQSALAFDPTAVSALLPSGILLAERGDFEAAQEALDRATALSPSDPQVADFAERLSALRAAK